MGFAAHLFEDALVFKDGYSYYIGSAEGHEYPDLQVGDEVNPRPFFALS
jgi:hypothetical protein